MKVIYRFKPLNRLYYTPNDNQCQLFLLESLKNLNFLFNKTLFRKRLWGINKNLDRSLKTKLLSKFWYDQAGKPSSVVCDNLSRQDVAALLQPPVGSAGPTITPQSVLHRIGFTWQRGLPRPGELLPRLSTLTGLNPAVSLCCTFPKVAFGCR